MQETRREQMIGLLTEGSWTLDSLAKYFDVTSKIIEDDLSHIEKSIKKTHSLKQIPPYCEGCGFVFKNRSRLQRPSRCPECKRERVTEGTIELVLKS
ncbi:MAG: transcriptional regulator [Candidatus Brocadiae bacterium]|nr:transcriptional regulator [Candidatus Brocadiia bacterium]